MEEIINLVDEKGNRIGEIEKMKAHVEGKLHEAFSIFVFNNKNELLLQRRAHHKYHSGGLLTNTCCSHPRVGENLEAATHRRLIEEMGFDCELKRNRVFSYRADNVGNSLIENEFDYLFFGHMNDDVVILPNPDEVAECKWMSLDSIKSDIVEKHENYTAWFKMIIGSGALEK